MRDRLCISFVAALAIMASWAPLVSRAESPDGSALPDLTVPVSQIVSPPGNVRGGHNVSHRRVSTDDREVYLLTSRIKGRYPIFGGLYHASIAICPKGVSPVVLENGVPVSNWRQCVVYGTHTGRRGFSREGKRVDVRATKIRGVSAATIEQRMSSHSELNLPLLNDCRHHAIDVVGLPGRIFERRLPLFVR